MKRDTSYFERSVLNYLNTSRVFLMFLILFLSISNAQHVIQGVAPVARPNGGFAVDGDVYARTPSIGLFSGSEGDWFDQDDATISGKGLFNSKTGEKLYPDTYHLTDFTKMEKTDFSVFTSSNKINDNPNTYTWGAGNAPAKDEIQNVYVHFTHGIGNYPNDVWCLFAADRWKNEGSSGLDFEILQKPLTITGAVSNDGHNISGGSGAFHSEGKDGGRTVGDLLISVEFTQGGKIANVVIQRWKAVSRGYQYVEQSLGDSDYISPGNIFCTANLMATSVPFPVFDGAMGYGVNQFVEGAVNLTEVFKVYSTNPCMVASTVFVSTRSSGNSMQSELKDFAGIPVQLNLIPNPATKNLAGCEVGTAAAAVFDLNNGVVDAGDGIISFYTSLANAESGDNPIADPTHYSAPLGITTIYVRSASTIVDICAGVKSFTITVTDNPDIKVKENLSACEIGATGIANFNLNDGVTDADGGIVSFYATQTEAESAVNPIPNPTVYTASIGETKIYVRSANGTCWTVASFTVIVKISPHLLVQDISTCEDGFTAAGTVDLNNGVIDAGGGVVTFHTSQADADAGTNAIANPTKYSARLGITKIYVRSANASANECAGTNTNSFNVRIIENPTVVTNDLTGCVGVAFNLNDGVQYAGGTLTFYTSHADAENGVNPIADPNNYSTNINLQVIYVRSVNGNCVGFAPIELHIVSCLVVPDVSKNINVVAYPNPFEQNLKIDIKTNSNEDLQLKVYNMLGRLIDANSMNFLGARTLEIGNSYPSGVYTVIVIQGRDEEVLKVVKKGL